MSTNTSTCMFCAGSGATPKFTMAPEIVYGMMLAMVVASVIVGFRKGVAYMKNNQTQIDASVRHIAAGKACAKAGIAVRGE